MSNNIEDAITLSLLNEIEKFNLLNKSLKEISFLSINSALTAEMAYSYDYKEVEVIANFEQLLINYFRLSSVTHIGLAPKDILKYIEKEILSDELKISLKEFYKTAAESISSKHARMDDPHHSEAIKRLIKYIKNNGIDTFDEKLNNKKILKNLILFSYANNLSKIYSNLQSLDDNKAMINLINELFLFKIDFNKNNKLLKYLNKPYEYEALRPDVYKIFEQLLKLGFISINNENGMLKSFLEDSEIVKLFTLSKKSEIRELAYQNYSVIVNNRKKKIKEEIARYTNDLSRNIEISRIGMRNKYDVKLSLSQNLDKYWSHTPSLEIIKNNFEKFYDIDHYGFEKVAMLYYIHSDFPTICNLIDKYIDDFIKEIFEKVAADKAISIRSIYVDFLIDICEYVFSKSVYSSTYSSVNYHFSTSTLQVKRDKIIEGIHAGIGYHIIGYLKDDAVFNLILNDKTSKTLEILIKYLPLENMPFLLGNRRIQETSHYKKIIEERMTKGI